MLACQKDCFSLPPDLHYLNCAYMSPLSKTVEEAGIRGIQRKRVPAHIGPEDFFAESDEARRLFARLIHGDARRVALIPAASYGLATVARNTPVGKGQNLVILHEQFPSNVYSWRRLADETGATVRTVPPPGSPEDRGRRWNTRVLEAIDRDTAVVALPHVHWADGTRFDLAAIGARAREVGAAFIVDGTQSVGALPFDVREIRPDALVCAGYKWLMGPYGLGLAYYGPRYDDGVPLEENWIGRKGSRNFSGLVAYEEAYEPGAVRYDVGERSNFTLVPMLVAGLRQVLDWDPGAIQAYCAALTAPALDEARRLGFRVEDAAWRGAHLFGLRAPADLRIDTLRETLEAHRVSVSVRGTAVRISPHVYNDEDDVAALGAALRACRMTVAGP